ncbi:PhnE/PtxC family ABC transporter permease [Bacillus sp. Au-Bac7]|uniref:PhnE/PtxC family ABC transporter permease n=1 Tax=Bacillus sp. Au-Bac7 TaxID=2906458 RepID=UPI001E34E8BF|nr:phosphate/phosphonate ABC transporter permease [Bacillus sp. Au-Bac7]MCE4049883.1 phosphate/phosphonate ABC transporter permease [Bacillus sp. Au-Bac7]
MSKSQMPIPNTLVMKESMLTKKKIPIAHKQTKRQQQYFFTTVGILFIVCVFQIDISFSQFQEGVARIPSVLSMMLQMSFAEFPELASEMVVSLVTAFLSLVLSIIFAVVLAFLAARNTTPNRYFGMMLRFLFMVIRAIPATVWVLIAVASIGFGTMAGVLGLIFPTCSYLVKSFSAQIEEVGQETIEALQSVGATWWHIVFRGLIPTLLTSFLAITAFRFEMNVAESVILGMVGAGGIGLLIQGYISFYDFSSLSLGIVMVFITMFMLEFMTTQIRKRMSN